ncbi:putative quinol monooxygenase [Aneurinibacillus terranovensis]|uniref:putative quinol monooxygenase n=1 Tax=Aneurinibacillus terranovensis TaxID=278991 RepID=UPI00040A79A7|nr:putative quinol monooxygenase [Aneurinibacillus terranovensis]
MIIIHAFIKVDPKHRTEFLELSKITAAASQAEEGNVSYQLYEDVEQSNTFVMLEIWKNQTAIEEHEETPHFINFINCLPDYQLEPIHVEKYEV